MPERKTPQGKGLTGSPSQGEPEYLVVGMLRRPHGVHGEILMDVHTDFPERLRPGATIWVGDQYQPQPLQAVRPHGQGLLVKFHGVDTPEAAGLYRNQWVYIPTRSIPALPEGEYYHHQLIGLQAIEDDTKRVLGTVKEILVTGANDVYVLDSPSGGELLLPAIPDVILKVDLGGKTILVRLLPGLVDLPGE